MAKRLLFVAFLLCCRCVESAVHFVSIYASVDPGRAGRRIFPPTNCYLSRVDKVGVQQRFHAFPLQLDVLVNLAPLHLFLGLVLARHSPTPRKTPPHHHTPPRPQLRHLDTAEGPGGGGVDLANVMPGVILHCRTFLVYSSLYWCNLHFQRYPHFKVQNMNIILHGSSDKSLLGRISYISGYTRTTRNRWGCTPLVSVADKTRCDMLPVRQGSTHGEDRGPAGFIFAYTYAEEFLYY